MRQDQMHVTTLSIVELPPVLVYAGRDLALRIRVECSSHCDLRGSTVSIVDESETSLLEKELVSFDGASNATDEFVIQAPTQPGEYTWSAAFARQGQQGAIHQESVARFSFTVQPHAVSMALWDVPSPVTAGAKFQVKVGVSCSAGCRLTGKQIEIYDHAQAHVATGQLGDSPWTPEGTLHWTEIELEAPGTEEYFAWEAKFQEQDPESLHHPAAHRFGFRTAPGAEHLVTVEAVDKDTHAPIERADLVLHPYRGQTDEHGTARVMVPKGEYELYVVRTEKKTFHTTVHVSGDVSVRAELEVAPVEDITG